MSCRCRSRFWVGVIALAFSLAGPRGLDGQTPTAEARAGIQGYLQSLEALGFSGAVGVTDNGVVVLQRVFGYADVQTRTPFTLGTGFFIASLSKQFTAALILALEDRGVLRTDDPITRHLSDVPPALAPVTIDQLLGHRSGLLTLDPPEMLESGAQVLAAGLRAGPSYRPGQRFDYSNAGYAFVAALAEQVTGKRYEELVRDLLFAPAGMTSTSVVTEPARWQGRRLATGYNGFLPQSDALLARPFGRELIGPGGIVTTIEDMMRWERALRAGSVLSAQSLQKFFTPGVEHYAYGWSVWESTRSGELTAAHDGHIMPEAFNSYYARLLQSGAAVVVFASRGDVALAERVAWDLIDLYRGTATGGLPEVGTSPVAPAGGFYAAENGARLRIHRLGSLYIAEPMNQAAANLFVEDTTPVAAATRRVVRWLDADDKDRPAALRATIAAVREQQPRFGAYAGEEVIYSVKEDGFLRTHVRHFLGRDTLYTRLDIVDGELAGGTDAGAFVAGGRGLPLTLGWIGMVPVGGPTWVAYDFWGSRTVEVSVAEGSLTVGGAAGSTLFRHLARSQD
ncbi:MAG TPA: serine hydrolase domain-containing protein [Gemmatimonadales bacterium]